ncbi:MAG: mechanosensitive ion channel [Proteobacteria bacterium]|nr:mechanosensitive ion channel [Pseudomonadota bacterium]
MKRFLFFVLFLFISIGFGISSSHDSTKSSPLVSKMLKTDSLQPEKQIVYLEEFGDFLNIIDDEKKRAHFVKGFSKFFTEDFLSIESYKNIMYYCLKLLIVVLAHFGLKKIGMKVLTYHMTVIANKRKERTLKNLNDEQNYLILETLASLFQSIFIWFLRVVFTLLFMIVMGINVGPIIYSVGFFGIALGLASQNIIKDFINGILIITDGSMAVGETIEVAGYKGAIEHITLRSLSLRNYLGELITIPFSSITDVINYSRHFAKIRAEVIVIHTQDLSLVREAFEEAYLKTKTLFPKDVSEPFTFSGVCKISEFGSHVAASFLSRPDPLKSITNAFLSAVHNAMKARDVQRIDARDLH